MLRKFFQKTPLAWFQVKREKMRLAVALAGIAFADVLIFVQLGLKDSLYDSVEQPYYKLDGELFIIDPLFAGFNTFNSFSRERLYQAARLNEVATVSALYIARGQWRNLKTNLNRNVLIFGIDPDKPIFTLPGVTQQANQLTILGRVLYDRIGRDDLFGDVNKVLEQSDGQPLAVQVNDRQVQIVGRFRLGASFVADSNLIGSDQTFLKLFPERSANQIDIGVIKLMPEADVSTVQAALKAVLPDDILVLTQAELADRERTVWEIESPIGFIFGFGTIIGFIVGIVIVYQVLYADVADHLSEYATLKAMGYSDRYLTGVLIQESLILATLGFIPGFWLSVGLYSIASSAILLPIAMTVNRAILVFLLTYIMCLTSGMVTLRKLQTADPADVF